jgi:hypothetical protein
MAKRRIPPLDETGVDHEAKRLTDEERVSFGLTLYQFGEWPRNCLLAGFGQQSLDFAGR